MANIGPHHRAPDSDRRAAMELLEQVRKAEQRYGTPTILAALAQIHSEESASMRARMHIRQAEEEYRLATTLRNCAERLKASAQSGGAHPLDGSQLWTGAKR